MFDHHSGKCHIVMKDDAGPFVTSCRAWWLRRPLDLQNTRTSTMVALRRFIEVARRGRTNEAATVSG